MQQQKGVPRGRSPPPPPSLPSPSPPPPPVATPPTRSTPTLLPIPPPSRPGSRSPSPFVAVSKIPALGVLIDRTSFDETEDYGVDQEALGATAWGREQLQQQKGAAGGGGERQEEMPPPPVVMRNGKVRRRLKWRPKALRKKKRPQRQSVPQRNGHGQVRSMSTSVLSGTLPGGNRSRRASTDGSVVSEQSSKASSKRSIHSFASIETMMRSNNTRRNNTQQQQQQQTQTTTEQRLLKFPLPRPGRYSPSAAVAALDEVGVPTAVTSETVTTIDNEGEAVLASSRMTTVGGGGGKPPPSPRFVASSTTPPPRPPRPRSALLKKAASSEEKRTTREQKQQQEHRGLSPNNAGRPSSNPKKPGGLPPLRKIKATIGGINGGGGGNRRRANSASTLLEKKKEEPNPPNTPRRQAEAIMLNGRTRSSDASISSVPGRFQSTPVASGEEDHLQDQQQQQQDPIPELCGEDVERDRLVDLRIRVPETRGTLSFGRLKNIVVPVPRPSLVVVAATVTAAAAAGDGSAEFPSIEELRSPSSMGVLSPSESQLSQPGRRQPSLPTSSQTAFQETGAYTNRASPAQGGTQTERSADVDPVIGPSVSYPQTATAASHDGEDGVSSSVPSSQLQQEELRFSLVHANNNSGVVNTTLPPVARGAARKPQVQTVPVDLDDCSFLEAEKNLQAIHDMAAEHLQQGEYDEALEVFEEILRGQLTRYGRDHFRVGTALHNIGIVQMKRKDYENAVNAYKESVSIRKKALAPDHPDVASGLSQLGVAYLERKMHKKAIVTFREALRIRRRCLGPSHPKIAKILNNIGCALYELNALPVARFAFEEALEIQRQNLRDSPVTDSKGSNYQLISIASTLSNIASIKLYLNVFDEASVDFQEALLIQQCVFGDDHPIPKQTEDSLKWIEDSKGTTRSRFSFSSTSQLDIISKLLSASLAEGRKGVLSCTNPPVDVDDGSEVLACTSSDAILDEPRSSKHQPSPTGVDLLDSVEKRFWSKLNFACGQDEESDDTEDDDASEYSSKHVPIHQWHN